MAPSGWRSLNERFFEALPIPSVVFTAGLAITLFGLYIATMHWTGHLAEFLAGQERWWQARDARLAVILLVIGAYLPAARRGERARAQRHLESLRHALPWPSGHFEESRRGSTPTRWQTVSAGILGLLVLPIVALLVDRDPGLYFNAGYWDAARSWPMALGAAVCWNVGVMGYSIFRRNRAFARLARGAPRVDLLRLDSFSLFTDHALGSIVPGIFILSLVAFNLVDHAFLWAVGLIAAAVAVWAGASILGLRRSVRERIASAKQAELASVDAALRGDSSALADSLIGLRYPHPGLGDLLAWRQFVSSIRESPLGAGVRARVSLYLAIPLGSWLGGALVERLLDALLG